MVLEKKLKKQGNFFFKYRGQIPILLFILVIPFIYTTNYLELSISQKKIFLIISITLSIIGFLVRFYTIATTPKHTSGRNREKQIAENLNIRGSYSIVRHPLYLANYLIWLGISFFTYNYYFIIFLSLFFWLYYRRIIYVEDLFLEKKFNSQYLDWKSKTSAFAPNFKQFIPPNDSFSFISILRREYSGVLSAIIAFAFIQGFTNYFDPRILSWKITDTMLWILISTSVLAVLLKVLKKYTIILKEENRS